MRLNTLSALKTMKNSCNHHSICSIYKIDKKQPTDQRTDRPIDQLTDQLTDRPTNQPTNWPTDWPTYLPTYLPIYLSTFLCIWHKLNTNKAAYTIHIMKSFWEILLSDQFLSFPPTTLNVTLDQTMEIAKGVIIQQTIRYPLYPKANNWLENMQLQLQVSSKYFVPQSTYLIAKIILINSTSSLKPENKNFEFTTD